MAKAPFLWIILWWLAASPVLAWNRAGHMVTGAIAYSALKRADPAALAKTLQLLRQQPQYASYWQRQVEATPGEDGEMLLFMLGARWADDIRGRPEFDHPAWHYIDYPYRPPSAAGAKPAGENIVDALEQNRLLVKTAADPAARAVALCWVMHLTGDIHQPLHATELFNGTFPGGDHGGTIAYIKVDDGETLSLHQLWDGLVLGSERFQAVRNTAAELMNRPPLTSASLGAELREMSAEKWAHDESFLLAQKFVYRGGTFGGGRSKTDWVALPPDYLPQARAVAERQLVLAGYRLAVSLRQLLP